MRTVCDRLAKSFPGAAIYRPDVQAAPAYIRWPGAMAAGRPRRDYEKRLFSGVTPGS